MFTGNVSIKKLKMSTLERAVRQILLLQDYDDGNAQAIPESKRGSIILNTVQSFP